MATFNYVLAAPPEDGRERDLWLQHAAGFTLMENVRQEAIRQLSPTLSDGERAAAIDAIDATIYQLMTLIDGVSGGLRNDEYSIDLRMLVQLRRRNSDDNTNVVVKQMDLRDGDGMSIGVHGWMEGDYGRTPVVDG